MRLFIVFIVGLYIFFAALWSFAHLDLSWFNIVKWEPVGRLGLMFVAAFAAFVVEAKLWTEK